MLPIFFKKWILHQLSGNTTTETYGSVWSSNHTYPLSKTNLSRLWNWWYFLWIIRSTENEICFLLDNYGILGEKLAFRGFHDAKIILNTDRYFNMKHGQTINEELPLPWKRSFSHGITGDKDRTAIKNSNQIATN